MEVDEFKIFRHKRCKELLERCRELKFTQSESADTLQIESLGHTIDILCIIAETLEKIESKM